MPRHLLGQIVGMNQHADAAFLHLLDRLHHRVRVDGAEGENVHALLDHVVDHLGHADQVGAQGAAQNGELDVGMFLGFRLGGAFETREVGFPSVSTTMPILMSFANAAT